MNSAAKNNASQPAWIIDFFSSAMERFRRVTEVTQAARTGLNVLHQLPGILEELEGDQSAPSSDEDRLSRKKRLLEKAQIAEGEIKEGFPQVNAFIVVAFWSQLEYTVKGLGVAWLLHNKSAFKSTKIHSLKVPVGEYAALTRQEQMHYLVDRLDQESSGPLRHGVNRFEALLGALGLSGSSEASVQEALYELQCVRNLIAHRDGQIDRAFIRKCPWFSGKLGSDLKVTRDMIAAYDASIGAYILELFNRVGDHYGFDYRNTTDELYREMVTDAKENTIKARAKRKRKRSTKSDKDEA